MPAESDEAVVKARTVCNKDKAKSKKRGLVRRRRYMSRNLAWSLKCTDKEARGFSLKREWRLWAKAFK